MNLLQTSPQNFIVPLAAGVEEVYSASGSYYVRQVDGLGSSRVQMNANNSFRGSLAYAPFGETYAESTSVDRSFTGQTQDVIAGTQGDYDFLFRQLSASQGRWLVPDPAGVAAVDITNPQTWNRYAYVANNPLSNVDPQGLNWEQDRYEFLLFWETWGNFWGRGWNRFEYQVEPPDRAARTGGGTTAPPPPPAPNPPNPGTTSTCTVRYGRTTAPAPGQAPGAGAFGFVPPKGSVAIDPMAVGLFPGATTNALLGPSASQITFSFSPAPNLPQGFATTHTLGSVVGPASVRGGGSQFHGLYDFDIFGLPSLAAAYAATSPAGVPVAVTVTYPSSLPINCVAQLRIRHLLDPYPTRQEFRLPEEVRDGENG